MKIKRSLSILAQGIAIALMAYAYTWVAINIVWPDMIDGGRGDPAYSEMEIEALRVEDR